MQLASSCAGLVKYKLSLAVSFSSATGYILAGGNSDARLFMVVISVFLLASGSAALNQVTERDKDAVMKRTMGRPVPSGKIGYLQAMEFAIVLLAAGSILLATVGLWPLLLGLLCIVLYNGIYTRLKTVTVMAVLPGAMVGAIPPAIGFLAAGGTLADARILSFSAFMFLWQLPHFWLVLMKYREDYKRAGFRTLSCYLDNNHIRNLVMVWVVLTSAFIIVFFGFSEIFGRYLARIIFILNPLFVIFFTKMLYSREEQHRFKITSLILNSFSILLMISLIIDTLLG